MDINNFMIGFSVVFVPALICFLAGGIMTITWVIVSGFEKLVENAHLEKQLRNLKNYSPTSAEVKRWVIERRQRQDEERIVRLKRRQAEATARLKPDLADEDVSQEQFEAGAPKYLLAKNPAIGGDGKTLYFKEVLAGRAVGEGSAGLRDAKPIWTPLRQYARRFILGEAQSWARRLPDNKNIFIVCDESGAAKKDLDAIVDRLVESGISLDELKEMLPIQEKNVCRS